MIDFEGFLHYFSLSFHVHHKWNLAIKLGDPDNSAPFDLNLDLLEVFSQKTTLQKGPILVAQFCSL